MSQKMTDLKFDLLAKKTMGDSEESIEHTIEELQIYLTKINHFIDSLISFEEWKLLKEKSEIDCKYFQCIHVASRQLKESIEESIKLKLMH